MDSRPGLVFCVGKSKSILCGPKACRVCRPKLPHSIIKERQKPKKQNMTSLKQYLPLYQGNDTILVYQACQCKEQICLWNWIVWTTDLTTLGSQPLTFHGMLAELWAWPHVKQSTVSFSFFSFICSVFSVTPPCSVPLSACVSERLRSFG